MKRLPDLRRFADEFEMPLISVAQLVAHRHWIGDTLDARPHRGGAVVGAAG